MCANRTKIGHNGATWTRDAWQCRGHPTEEQREPTAAPRNDRESSGSRRIAKYKCSSKRRWTQQQVAVAIVVVVVVVFTHMNLFPSADSNTGGHKAMAPKDKHKKEIMRPRTWKHTAPQGEVTRIRERKIQSHEVYITLHGS